MAFVQRTNTKVSGVYSTKQAGYAEEELADNHPEVVAYLAPTAVPTLDDIYDQAIQNQKVLKALVLALNDGSFIVGGNKTGAQVKAILKAKM